MRALRTRVAFPVEVHVEAFAPPPRPAHSVITDMLYGYGKTTITGIDQAASTYTITTPGPRPDMIFIDETDVIRKARK